MAESRSARLNGRAPRRQDFYVFTAWELHQRDRLMFGELLARCAELEGRVRRLTTRLNDQRERAEMWRNRCGVKNKRGGTK